MKKLLFSAILLHFLSVVIGQTTPTIITNKYNNLVCPYKYGYAERYTYQAQATENCQKLRWEFYPAQGSINTVVETEQKAGESHYASVIWGIPSNGIKGTITVSTNCYDNPPKTTKKDIIILSIRDKEVDKITINNSTIPYPYTYNVEYKNTNPISVKALTIYPNSNVSVKRYEWELPAGWTAKGYSTLTKFMGPDEITVYPTACTGGQILVRPVDDYCGNENVEKLKSQYVSNITVNRVATKPTIPTVSPSLVIWGTNSNITCTTSSNPVADSYEWEFTGGFEGAPITITTSSNTITRKHLGCTTGTVSVRAIYCSNQKSEKVSRQVSVNVPNIYISGPDELNHRDTTYTLEGIHNSFTFGINTTWSKSNNIDYTSTLRGVSIPGGSFHLDTNLKPDPFVPHIPKISVKRSADLDPLACESGYISATVSYKHCQIPTVTKTVKVGFPPYKQMMSSIYNNRSVTHGWFCSFVDNATYYGNIISPGNSYGITGGEWRTVDSSVMILGPATPSIYDPVIFVPSTGVVLRALFPNYTPFIYVETRLKNACGWSDWVSLRYQKGTSCLSKLTFTYSPNPTKDVLNLTILSLPKDTINNALPTSKICNINKTSKTCEIVLYNNNGFSVFTTSFTYHDETDIPKSPIQIPTNNLPIGTYFLHVTADGETEMVQIYVE